MWRENCRVARRVAARPILARLGLHPATTAQTETHHSPSHQLTDVVDVLSGTGLRVRRARRSACKSAYFCNEECFAMANTKSAVKAARQAVRRTGVNKARASQVKSYVRKVEEAIASGDKDAAKAALADAQPLLMRSAQKRAVHKKTASRKVSRLTARLKAMA
jgi:small subunit ribosomal protein S20